MQGIKSLLYIVLLLLHSANIGCQKKRQRPVLKDNNTRPLAPVRVDGNAVEFSNNYVPLAEIDGNATRSRGHRAALAEVDRNATDSTRHSATRKNNAVNFRNYRRPSVEDDDDDSNENIDPTRSSIYRIAPTEVIGDAAGSNTHLQPVTDVDGDAARSRTAVGGVNDVDPLNQRSAPAEVIANARRSHRRRRRSLRDETRDQTLQLRPAQRRRTNQHRRPDPAAFMSRFNKRKPLDLGRMDHVCRHCKARHWIGERSGGALNNPEWEKCCKKGDVVLEPLQAPPRFLHELLTSAEPFAKDFRSHIRAYNSCLAFTSVNCDPDNRAEGRNGINCFQIHGELYHRHGPLEPQPGRLPCYAQLIFYDPECANTERMRRNTRLKDWVLRRVTDELYEINPYIQIYKTAKERMYAAEASHEEMRIILNPQIRLVMEMGTDRRRYNLPTGSEVAVIIADDQGKSDYRDIVVEDRNDSSLKPIHPDHPSYMPLHYVLLFPYGDDGYSNDLELLDPDDVRKNKSVSQRAYYRYRLHPHEDERSALFYGCRLFQQYVVDAWAICDQSKLQWLRYNQKNIRADLYKGLADAVLGRQDVDAAAIGRRVILPSSHLGGDRFMQQLFQDSMAIVRHFGRPTLFITFTTNPRWEEIQRELLPGQEPIDRPDLVARVFHLKVKKLLAELKQGNIFGRYQGHVYTIEYQKRCLPHIHLLLFLHPDDHFQDANSIDQIVSAELPDPTLDPTGELTEIIKSCMVHGPCGAVKPNAPCMVAASDGGVPTCSKHYPRPFQSETVVKEDGYPLYRRRDDGRTWTAKSGDRTFTFDNRWVVPYNPYLSARYKAHINVEICASVQAIKYINKYVYKGADRTTVRLGNENDEIARYLQGRYIGPTEAIWRLFEFSTHGEYPSVTHLAIHLPGEQPVYFADDLSQEELQQRLENTNTTLTAFFQYNAENADGRQHLYQDFPTHYVYVGKDRKWKLREKGTAVGRIYHCNPTMGEKYYLRMLLTVVRGPRSFENLRTVDGVLHPTFRAACLAKGLLEDDQEWVDCFAEAVLFSSGVALRTLFTTALLFGQVGDPLALWIRFREHLCDDLPHRLRQRDDVPDGLVDPHYDYGLFLIHEVLADSSKTLADFNLPPYTHDWNRNAGNPLIAAQLQYDVDEERTLAEERRIQLNVDQARCFDSIIAAIEADPQTAHFFLQGPAGTGKTFLYKCLCHHYRAQGKIVLCIASSGIAALLLPGGRTSHSQFKIPLQLHENAICAISKNTQLADLLRQTALIIWDEVPMQHKHCFEAVHRTLGDIRDDDQHLFGGIPVVLGGDFAQILPVVRKGNRSMIVNACLQQSFLWPQLRQLTLRQNMRVRIGEENQRFAEWISSLSYDPNLYNRISLPPSIVHFYSLQHFCDHVFPREQLQHAYTNPSFFKDRAILSMRNDTVAALNDYLIEQFPGDSHLFESIDTADVNNTEDGSEQLPIEYLRSLTPAGLPPATLRLKVGAPIILLRNLYPKQGLCNGTRMVITQLGRRCIEARMVGGDFDGELRVLPRIRLTTTEGELPFVLTRKQFPIRLCFAMTVNKAQGQSLNVVGVDLRSSAFTHGQLYVALSRVTNVLGLSVLLSENSDDRTDNVVYPEVLLPR